MTNLYYIIKALAYIIYISTHLELCLAPRPTHSSEVKLLTDVQFE